MARCGQCALGSLNFAMNHASISPECATCQASMRPATNDTAREHQQRQHERRNRAQAVTHRVAEGAARQEPRPGGALDDAAEREEHDQQQSPTGTT